VARCLALLGMVATHVLDERTASGDLTLGQALAGGRAAALFAVLAGVSIALVTGRAQPFQGVRRARATAGLAVRAVLIAGVGLVLAETDSGIAVILTYYGVLFLLALPFLGLSARWLALVAGIWVVAAPVVSHWLRPRLPERGFSSPSWGQLVEDPLGMLSELTFTGYYPAVPWLAYLLVGMAIGRLDLTSRRASAALLAVGAVIAAVATVVSRALTDRPGIGRALLTDPRAGDATVAALLDRISEGLPGTTPADGAWEWLLVVAPHTGTPFDLAQTIGSALVVIGLALLVVGATSGVATRAIALFFGAGTMTLTLYSLHVVLRSPELLPDGLRDSFRFHALLLLGIGLVFVAAGRRGPLERIVAAPSRTVAPRLPP
jgi:hypothetical protein